MCFNHNFFFLLRLLLLLLGLRCVRFIFCFCFICRFWVEFTAIVLCDYYAPQLHFSPFTFQIKLTFPIPISIPISKTRIYHRYKCTANHKMPEPPVHFDSNWMYTKYFVKCYSSPTWRLDNFHTSLVVHCFEQMHFNYFISTLS